MQSLLTGDTCDRAMPVKRLMESGAPLFLVNLKAGHVDLNAVDTAIHFDHWWNSTAEGQAGDRPRRIG